ncbi:M56 family metallopeptidase [Aquisphaera insulae]|uniref:M56 family metallopeptidase n=1 Tax=Aquisphaera insulae TaxID=2712864 RepID=UPI0013EA1D3F|nr:M56 family metallopeptidase [Aquisphaera insulae]
MLWWFAETTLVAGSLAAAAALCGRLTALGAPARHLLWVLVLVKLVTPPVVPAPWSVPLPILPAAEPSGEPAEIAASDHDVAAEAEAEAGIDAGVAIAPEGEPSPAAVAMPVSYSAEGEGGRTSLRGLDAAAMDLREAAGAGRLRASRRGEREAGATPTAGPAGASILPAWLSLPSSSDLCRWLLIGWGVGAAALAAVQGRRILAFRGRLRDAVPAPEWLVDEAEELGRALRVRPPEVLVATGIGSPLLWCLGRPRLLIPAHLVKSIDANRWRGILAHELAHLRRGDHWVSRLELAAGLVWWWNPLYWIARRRIDAEAELACDAWVVSTLPADRDRHAYAEVLLQICSELSPLRPKPAPAPALGVAGSGRFLERRLIMVLNAHRDDPSACRIAPVPLAAACLLGLLALPSWSLAKPVVPPPAFAAEAERPQPPDAAEDDDADADAAIAVAQDDDDDDDDDKDKDKDDDRAKLKKDKEKARAAEKSEAKGDDDDDDDKDADEFAEKIEKSVEEALGPDFEKKMEAWGEKFGAEMEKQFGDGSEFAKKMEAFGAEMEKKFGDGSEFAKKMEAFGAEMEKKFGPGSDFEKKFGPGSDFEKKMESLGKKMEEKFGPGSDFEKKVKEKAEAAAVKAKEHAAKAQQKMVEAEARAKAQAARDEAHKHKAEAEAHHDAKFEAKPDTKFEAKPDRDRRIKDLESKVEMLLKEIKSLKDEG